MACAHKYLFARIVPASACGCKGWNHSDISCEQCCGSRSVIFWSGAARFAFISTGKSSWLGFDRNGDIGSVFLLATNGYRISLSNANTGHDWGEFRVQRRI
jgi:hypothetical protein